MVVAVRTPVVAGNPSVVANLSVAAVASVSPAAEDRTGMAEIRSGTAVGLVWSLVSTMTFWSCLAMLELADFGLESAQHPAFRGPHLRTSIFASSHSPYPEGSHTSKVSEKFERNEVSGCSLRIVFRLGSPQFESHTWLNTVPSPQKKEPFLSSG